MTSDRDRFLETDGQNGGSLWSAEDGSIGKGGAFSTLEAGVFLKEFGYTPDNGTKLNDLAEKIFENQQEGIRFRTYRSGSSYPCQTINAARSLCILGYQEDRRLDKTLEHLLEIQHVDGGWKCPSWKYGRGPETQSSNPGPSLSVLDIFRYRKNHNQILALEKTVDFLLQHWVTRAPLGPCHYGIGTQFFKVEYPMLRYNLLTYVYVLSFYEKAVGDARFRQALDALQSKVSGQCLPVESPPAKLRDYSFYREGTADRRAWESYSEIRTRLRVT